VTCRTVRTFVPSSGHGPGDSFPVAVPGARNRPVRRVCGRQKHWARWLVLLPQKGKQGRFRQAGPERPPTTHSGGPSTPRTCRRWIHPRRTRRGEVTWKTSTPPTHEVGSFFGRDPLCTELGGARQNWVDAQRGKQVDGFAINDRPGHASEGWRWADFTGQGPWREKQLGR